MKKYGIWIFFGFIVWGLLAGCSISQNSQIPQTQQTEPPSSTLPVTSRTQDLPVASTLETGNSTHPFSGFILIIASQPGKLFLYNGVSLSSIQISTDDIHQPAPKLSRDGKNISYRDLVGYLNVYTISTQDTKQYTSELTNGGEPMGWSPNKGKIAFGCPIMPANICVLTLKTGTVENYTKGLPNNASDSYAGYNFAGWSEDDTKMGLLFEYEPPSSGGQTFYTGTIEVMDTKTKAITKVLSENDLTGIEHIQDAMISPDGTAFLFSAKSGGYYAVYRVNADGTGLTRVTSESLNFNTTHPIWRPDGNGFVASAPENEKESSSAIILPTIFDLSGRIIGQINIAGGGEAVSWIDENN